MSAFNPFSNIKDIDIHLESNGKSLVIHDKSDWIYRGMTVISIDSIEVSVQKINGTAYITDVTDQFTQTLGGVITFSSASTALTGASTTFDLDLSAGDLIVYDASYLSSSGKEFNGISSVTTDTGAVSMIPFVSNEASIPYGKLNTVFTLDYGDLGGSSSEAIPDGLYDIIYSITITYLDNQSEIQVEYTYTERKLFYSQVACCVSALWADLAQKMCDTCDYKAYLNDVLLAEALLKGLIANANCNNVEFITNIIDTINGICDFNNCTNC